jgi:hypothetical protein
MKEKKHYIVTNADKVAHTLAYQKLIAGDPRYKAADHLDDEYIKIMTQHGDGP